MWGGGVLLCMCDSKATLHCVNNRPKMCTQKVVIEGKVVFEFSFKVFFLAGHKDCRIMYNKTHTQLHSPSNIPPPPSSFHQLKHTQRY
jgi:hypothetical protein